MRVKNLSGIVTRLAAILLCLVLFSAHLASGMFAKYSVGASEGGEARVAKIDFSVIEREPLTLDSLGNGTYKFLVKNNSEVAFQYDINLRVISSVGHTNLFGASEIAKICTDVKLDGVAGTPSTGGSLYTFALSDRLEPDSESHEYVLTFKAADLAYNAASTTLYNIPIRFYVSAKGTQLD